MFVWSGARVSPHGLAFRRLAASPWTRYASQLANALDGGTIVLDDAVVASGGVLGAGSTAIFQCLYRDGLGSPCGTGMNATHALEIVLAP